jgi:acetyl-CoA carboxylase biotin carboxyl carrier protein
MNITEIQDLIKFFSKSGISEVEITKKDFKITIKGEQKGDHVVYMPSAAPAQVAAPVAQTPAAVASAPVATPPAASADAESKLIVIKSPMIGTFYRSSSPDKPVLKSVGDSVAIGDGVCIIEAMKLFNEIESEVAGKIVKVLVDDSSPVEYDQPLFLVDPS